MPKVHYDDCPACNPKSQTSMDDYVQKVRVKTCEYMRVKRFSKTLYPAKDFLPDRSLPDEIQIVEKDKQE